MTPLPHNVGDEMNIGKPLPNNTVYVLDEDMKPLPIGETGKFCRYLNHFLCSHGT